MSYILSRSRGEDAPGDGCIFELKLFICYCRKSSFAIKLPCVYANFAQKGRNTRLRTVYWTLEFVLFLYE